MLYILKLHTGFLYYFLVLGLLTLKVEGLSIFGQIWGVPAKKIAKKKYGGIEENGVKLYRTVIAQYFCEIGIALSRFLREE